MCQALSSSSVGPGNEANATMKFRSSEFMDVNKALYEWYLIACSKNVYPGGPELIEKAEKSQNDWENPTLKDHVAGWASGRHDLTSSK